MRYLYALIAVTVFMSLSSVVQAQPGRKSDSLIFDYLFSYVTAIHKADTICVRINRTDDADSVARMTGMSSCCGSCRGSAILTHKVCAITEAALMVKYPILFLDPEYDVKHVNGYRQWSLGIRQYPDFNLFFSRPVRASETAVYIDGVRLINP